MPNFNEFRIDQKLLGKVLVARRKSDIDVTEQDDLEVRNFLAELDEEKRAENKNLLIRITEKITGKKLAQYTGSDGKKTIREYDPSQNKIKPIISLSKTIPRPIDFGSDVNAWRTYIHQQHIDSENEYLKSGDREKTRQKIVQAFSDNILKKMLEVN